ncbi:leucine zipper protein 1 [Microcaecilia unicolor]|uniref:Leucine zipper protein 1 n=1 Tax=Microcaecilia unicolor TaxID=1415580 RepID=A0A6P7ZD82_9AMPH|nr:leucine zipper protein 1-like [Microcaecilia unicolor]XP_030075708.1 leucine zipper protein 1 [Microcaecilia unicolor]
MTEVTSFKEPSNRHLRFKLQSLSRRLDDLEEATRNLQKAEEEVLDLQDKIIQAEGSNSSMLADVEALRKRVLKIEGKDEEIRKAEELCRQVKVKLEEEESISGQLRSDVVQLQKQMADLEKLEEAFSRSKSDCMQLCISLNEEKNLTKKLSTELELLRVKVKEMESSESRLEKSEQQLASDLEKLKSLTLNFASERKGLLEKEKQSEKLIEELTQKLEQINKSNADDQTRKAHNRLERSSDAFMERNDLRIEDDLIPREGRRKRSFDYLKLPDNETNKVENEKNKNQEDNKIKDLNQEIEKLKIQLKQFEAVEEELEKMQTTNNKLQERYLSEQNKARLLNDQVQELTMHMKKQKDLENGEAEREEILSHEKLRHDRAKNRGTTAESPTAKHTSREMSPQQGRDRLRHREPSDGNPQGTRHSLNTSAANRRAAKSSSLTDAENDVKRTGEKVVLSTKETVSVPPEIKKSREQPSVLSRYPPAAQEQHTQKSWKVSTRLGNKGERTLRTYGDASSSNTVALNGDMGGVIPATKAAEREAQTSHLESLDPSSEKASLRSDDDPSNESGPSSHAAPLSLESSSSCSSAVVESLGSSQRGSFEVRVLRAAGNSEDGELSDIDSQGTNYPSCSRSQKQTLQTAALEEFKGSANYDTCITTQSEQGLKSQVNRRGGMKPKIATKPVDSEKLNTDASSNKVLGNTINSNDEKGNTFAQLEMENKTPSSPRVGLRARGTGRTADFQSDKTESGAEEESERPIKAKSNAMEKEDPSLRLAGKTKRPFSPREALQTKAIIKPAIIEKDIKELMSGAGSDGRSEKGKRSPRTVSNKMTSSIMIYPSEVVTPRTINTENSAREKELSENSDTVTARTSSHERARERNTSENSETVTARITVTENGRGRKTSMYKDSFAVWANTGEKDRGKKTSENSETITSRPSISDSLRETSGNSDAVSARTGIEETARERDTDSTRTTTSESSRERKTSSVIGKTSENSNTVTARTSNGGNTRDQETANISDSLSDRISISERARQRETAENSETVVARTTSTDNPRRRKTPIYSETITTSRTSTGESPRGRKTSTYSDSVTVRTSRAESTRERETVENSDTVTSTGETASERETSENSNTVSARISSGERDRKRPTSENSDTSTRTRIAENVPGRRAPLYSETIISPRTSVVESSRRRDTSENSELATARTNVRDSARGRDMPTYTETVTARTGTGESVRERHTSTSNIRIIPNELPVVTNSINTPFEISINKSDVSLKVSELEKSGDLSPKNKADILISRSSITIKPLDPAENKNNGNQELAENISWKSHSIESDPVEVKSARAESSWRARRALNSLEELDGKVDTSRDSADTASAKWNRPSLLDVEAKPGKTREPYSRRTSAIVHSWNTPELVSRRSKSSLSASEIGTRRSYNPDFLLSSSLLSWDQSRVWEESSDLLYSTRRRRDRERARRLDLAGNRSSPRTALQTDSYPKGTKVEERVRQLNHYLEEK